MSAAARPVRVGAVLVGRARPFGPNGEPSAIDKRPAETPLRVGVIGFDGDEQGDPRHHGGPDKAVHHYPAEHYAAWRREYPRIDPARLAAGGFGENLSTVGLTEANVCVGDLYRVGGALLQVSQARQPCWKLNLRFAQARMAERVQASGRTGWYYRVREAGKIAPGDALELVERPYREWPLARLLHHLYADPLDREALAAMAALAVLPASWRKLAQQRLASGRIEDWSRRLSTPAAAAAAAAAAGIDYRQDAPLAAAEVAALFAASGIRRPVGDLPRIARMLANANLVVSAWDGERLVGVARALTDFSYCCYLSDLAVDRAYQKHGIGRALVERVRAAIGEETALILLSAPEAMAYYPKLGFERADNAFIIKRKR